MKKNIQYPTSNIQRPRGLRPGGFGCSALDVGFWLFFFLIFPVLPLSAQSNNNALPPLAPAYGIMQPTFWERHETAILITIFVFVALVGAACWIIFRPKPAAAVPPEVLAREKLTKLARAPEAGTVLSEISQTLQHYIITTLGLPPGERTSGEFSTALASNKKISAELARAISDFLRECDQRKFAPANQGASLNAASRALEIVSEMEKQRAKFAVQN